MSTNSVTPTDRQQATASALLTLAQSTSDTASIWVHVDPEAGLTIHVHDDVDLFVSCCKALGLNPDLAEPQKFQDFMTLTVDDYIGGRPVHLVAYLPWNDTDSDDTTPADGPAFTTATGSAA